MAKKTNKKSHHPKHSSHKENEQKKVHEHKELLNPKKVGLALGYTGAIYILFLSLFSAILNRGTPIVSILSSIYIGYRISFLGILIGVFWCFVDCFIGGFIFALIYNKVQKCKCGCRLLEK